MVEPLLVKPHASYAPTKGVAIPAALMVIRLPVVGVVVVFNTDVGAVPRLKNKSLNSCPASVGLARVSCKVTVIVPFALVVIVPEALTGCPNEVAPGAVEKLIVDALATTEKPAITANRVSFFILNLHPPLPKLSSEKPAAFPGVLPETCLVYLRHYADDSRSNRFFGGKCTSTTTRVDSCSYLLITLMI